MSPADTEHALAPSLAAMHLSCQLGGSQELWLYRLANWRRPGRNAPISFRRNEAGNPGYSLDALNKFISEKLSDRALVAESRESATVRCGAMSRVDSADEGPHVRLAIFVKGVSSTVYAISASSARQLAAQLLRSAGEVDQFTPAAAL